MRMAIPQARHPAAPAPATRLAARTAAHEVEQQADRVAEQVMRMPASPRWRAQPQPVAAVAVAASPRAAPPVVQDLLRTPGLPLEPAARDFMAQRFGHDFAHIRIHADRQAARAAAALGAEAFAFGHHLGFARGRFRPGAGAGRRLLAHELTHALQQQAAAPQLALQPSPQRRAPKSGRDGIVGGLLGWNHANEQVWVTRELGGARGFDARRQAIAVARLARAEPAAVVQDGRQKWHAVEISADFEAGPDRTARGAMDAGAEEDSPFLAVYGLPPLARIAQSERKAARLKAKQAELDARAVTGQQERQALEAEKDRVRADLAQAELERASGILGVHASEIKLASSFAGREAGMVNIVGTPDPGSNPGGHGPVGGDPGFELGRDTAFWMTYQRLGEPQAPGTLFHEVTHQRDWALAQQWVGIYQTETRRPFVKSATQPLRAWLQAQVKKARLSKADAEMVLMQATDATAYTEAHANVLSFLVELQSGEPERATESLVAYARALKPRSQGGTGSYAHPAAGSEVVAALVAELKAAYRRMPKAMQAQYDAAVAAARKENPAAWIAELDFGKRAAK